MAVTPVSIPGLSTMGVIVSYGVETVAGTKPETFTQLQRCNEIDELALDVETIDASALEDAISRYIDGRADTGGDWSLTFNLTNETQALIENMISASNTAYAAGKSTWFQVTVPNLTKSFFIVGRPPQKVPVPSMGQNELLTVAISIAVADYKGLDTTVTPTN